MNKVELALAELKKGKMIIVTDDEGRENEGDLIAAAEFATPKTINFMATYAKGLICTPISKSRAQELGLTLMVPTNTSSFETAFTESIDSIKATTGISAFERSETVIGISNLKLGLKDFKKPGHIFPLIAKEGGVLQRPGHTEASLDLMKLANLNPSAVICEIMDDDGEMLRGKKLEDFAKTHDLVMITVEDIIHFRKYHENLIKDSETITLPTKFGLLGAKAYISQVNNEEHIAIYNKEMDPSKPITVRLHSECLTGDVFGSLRCDCGEQLEIALSELKINPNSLIIYLKQEGRGIGLFNKIRSYKLQEDGMDTAEANVHLGFDVDLREYYFAAQILKDLKIKDIILLTNNPKKVQGLKDFGINILKRVPISVKENTENSFYLATKRKKFGHILDSRS